MSSLWATDRRLLPQKSFYLIDCKAIDMAHPRGDLRWRSVSEPIKLLPVIMRLSPASVVTDTEKNSGFKPEN